MLDLNFIIGLILILAVFGLFIFSYIAIYKYYKLLDAIENDVKNNICYDIKE